MDYFLGALTTAVIFGFGYLAKVGLVDRLDSLEEQVNDVNEIVATLVGGDE